MGHFAFLGPNSLLELTPQIYDVLTDLICADTWAHLKHKQQRQNLGLTRPKFAPNES